MLFEAIFKRFRAPDLQGKVILILIAVIFPVSVVVGLAQSKVMEPAFYEEIRQVGLSFAQNLANQIESGRLLSKPEASRLIEDRIQRMIYAQPGILRVDVIAPRAGGKELVYLASSIEDQEMLVPPSIELGGGIRATVESEDEVPVWSILYPVKSGPNLAVLKVLVSLGFVSAFQSTLFKINIAAALLSTILLIMVLSFLLRRAIENERQLREAQESNAVLSGKLQEIQQSLIQTEKLAVMGQLTASFAHEIGTPLNSVSGHVQLLKMGLKGLVPETNFQAISDRIATISGQISRIEDIVKGFLATTRKPIAAGRVRVPIKDLVDHVVALVQPSLQVNGIHYREEVLKPVSVEVVPIEIEQVILNLVNNAIYSMRQKSQEKDSAHELAVRISSDPVSRMACLEIRDTGMGISDENIKRVFKPFFTTKPVGEGHGLGLSICQEIIHSYGGQIAVESQSGAWTLLRVNLPQVEET